MRRARGRRPSLWWLLVACLSAASSLSTACSRPEAEQPRPLRANVILISLDTLAPAHMSAYGHDRLTTPAIDALAEDSLLFENAFSSSCWTLPAHASMLTGLYPKSLAADPNSFQLYKAAPLLSHRFQQNGYRTAAFTGGGYVSSFFGVHRGFEQFEGSKTTTVKDAVTLSASEYVAPAGGVLSMRAV